MSDKEKKHYRKQHELPDPTKKRSAHVNRRRKTFTGTTTEETLSEMKEAWKEHGYASMAYFIEEAVRDKLKSLNQKQQGDDLSL